MNAEAVAEIRERFEEALKACTDAAAVESLRVRYLGRKGILKGLFRELGKVPAGERKKLGRALNELRDRIESLLKERADRLGTDGARREEPFDVTLPGIPVEIGNEHPIYRTMDEICSVFERLGFEVVYGPEIETEYNNFEALNIAKDHPSRDPWDSYYVDDRFLLRSHTSPVQIRTMKKRRPPLRIVAPGKVFRPDTVDASHLPQFHQVEGLVVDEAVTFAHLKGTLDLWAKATYGPGVRTRFRPSFFPFTEPSAEVEVSCMLCDGREECPACKQTGWIEILGAGMVHPKVLENCGIDPERFTGFAFGMGVERIAMLKYGVRDIRLFLENRISFLKQFP